MHQLNEWSPFRESLIELCNSLPDNSTAQRIKQSLVEDFTEDYDLFPAEAVRGMESFAQDIRLWFASNPDAEEAFEQWNQ